MHHCVRNFFRRYSLSTIVGQHFAVLLLLVAPLWTDLSGSVAMAQAQRSGETAKLLIATRAVPPFAYQQADGRWQGIAIDLWEKAASELELQFEYQDVSLAEMLSGVESGKYDAAVGALSATAERETLFNFSHPFYHTGLGIAVKQDTSTSWFGFFKALVSPAFLGAVSALLGLLAIIGALVWLFERKSNEQFPTDPIKGIGAGLWWSSVTMTTVGYGDKAPITLAGRLVGLVWMFASIIIISTVTAGLTTALTLDALGSSIEGEDDLSTVRTATVSDSTSAARLTRKGISYRPYPDLDAAMSALAADQVDAVVYDQPLLRYVVRTQYADSLTVLSETVEPQVYAIGLPNTSKIRESLNQRLLANTTGQFWSAVLERHLGKD